MRLSPTFADLVLSFALVSGVACSSPEGSTQDAGFDVPTYDVPWSDSPSHDTASSADDAGQPAEDAAVDASRDGRILAINAASDSAASDSAASDVGVGDAGAADAGTDGFVADTGTDSAVACADGTFDADDNPATECRPWSACESGEYVGTRGDGFSDQECAGCQSGTFSFTANAESCSNWTRCLRGSFVDREGSTTQDRTCALCPDNRYSSGENQAQCIELELCSAGTVQTRAGTPTSAAECAECMVGEYCAGSEAPRETCAPPTWDHDADPATTCAEWTECVPGTFVAEAGDAQNDRLCQGCGAETFSDEPNAPHCQPWRDCAAGEAPTPGSTSRDRDCAPIMEM